MLEIKLNKFEDRDIIPRNKPLLETNSNITR